MISRLQLKKLSLFVTVATVLFIWHQHVNPNQRSLGRHDVASRLSLAERVGDIPLVVHRPPVCKRERVNIVFVKTHKCATSTTVYLLHWAGMRRNLSFVLPRPHQYTLCYPYSFKTNCFRPPKKPFNIMCHHVVFNEDVISRIMPSNSVYVTNIREPFDRMKSAFYFYSVRKWLSMPNTTTDPLSVYLRDIPKYEYEAMHTSPGNEHFRKCMGNVSFTHNTLAFELGLPTGFHVGTTDQTNNATYIRRWIDALQHRFSLVMIVEYYNESLVLLRRLMCWKLIDILYTKRNIRKYRHKDIHMDPVLVNNFRRYNEPEYILYDHFNKTLWRRIAEEPDDFRDELSHFNALVKDATDFCRKAKHDDVRLFHSSKWNEKFVITVDWCERKELDRQLVSAYKHDPVNVIDSSDVVAGC